MHVLTTSDGRVHVLWSKLSIRSMRRYMFLYGHSSDACIHPYLKTAQLTSLAWRPASRPMHGGIIRLLHNCAQIIPATKRPIYILLNAIQTRSIQLSDNRQIVVTDSLFRNFSAIFIPGVHALDLYKVLPTVFCQQRFRL